MEQIICHLKFLRKILYCRFDLKEHMNNFKAKAKNENKKEFSVKFQSNLFFFTHHHRPTRSYLLELKAYTNIY